MMLAQLCCMLVTPFGSFVISGSVADGGGVPFFYAACEQGCLLGFFPLMVVINTSSGFCF